MTAFLRTAAFCLLGFVLPSGAADRVALIIGNNEYPADGNFHPLQNCVNDAKLVADTLKDVGFRVTLLTNATFSEMDEALLKFETSIPKDGTAVVYFAGHGIEYQGQNYLMGSNAKLKARSRLGEEALKADTFAAALVQAGAKSSFLLLDCCRELPTSAEWMSRGQRKFGLADISIAGDIVIGMAAAPGQPALEPKAAGGNSPYALALAKWIPKGLKHTDMFDEVRREVDAMTEGKQRTWENGSFLNPFFFSEGAERSRDDVGTDTSAVLAEMRAKLDEVQRRNRELEKAMANRNTSEAEIQRLRKELEEANRAAEDTMKKTSPGELLPKPAEGSFSATRGIVPGQPFTSSVGTKFVWVEPGTFTMGSSPEEQAALTEAGGKPNSYNDESSHRVTIGNGYWVGAYEVTIGDYLRFLNESGQWNDSWVDLNDEEWSPIERAGSRFRMREGKGATWGEEKLPMVKLSWDGAVAYCEWLSEVEERKLPEGYRFALPTEAEWEKAARAGTEGMTYVGDLTFVGERNVPELDEIAWYGGNSGLDHEGGYDTSDFEEMQYNHQSAGTQPVGLKRPNPIGAYDMIGNVWEWCQDYYEEDYYRDGHRDPEGPESGSKKVARGGSWFPIYTAHYVRVSERSMGPPELRSWEVGFRVSLRSKVENRTAQKESEAEQPMVVSKPDPKSSLAHRADRSQPLAKVADLGDWHRGRLEDPSASEIADIRAALPSEATAVPRQARKILLFCLSEGFVKTSIPYGNIAFQELGRKTGAYDTVISDQYDVFTRSNLQQFDAILFNNTSNLSFENEAHRTALLEFVEGGKGVIGIGGATDNFKNWEEAAAMLGGIFNGHPWIKSSIKGPWAFRLDDANHPLVTAFGGVGFWHSEQIYWYRPESFRGAENLRILVSLDMAKEKNREPLSGPRHSDVLVDRVEVPVSWIQEYQGGRVFYSNLGQYENTYTKPRILRHFLDGIQWAIGDLDADATPTARARNLRVSPAPDEQ